ncbi:MAG: hypothetical protein WA974_03740 [Thermodesulfobacteriota bacterium]
MPPIELKDVTRSYLTVFQSFNLIPMLTAEENIALPRWLDGISSEETGPQVETLLQQMGLVQRRK